MNFIKSWQFSLVIAVLVAVLAVAGVVYGVLTHEEPGWMPEGPLWQESDIPISVCPATYASLTATDADVAHALYVVSLLNNRVGSEIYRVSSESDCSLTLTYGVPAQRGWQDPGGSATLNWGARICDVEVSNVMGEVRILVVYHELGHCLGLAHDDYDSSIMRPMQRYTPQGQIPPGFSDSDVSLLQDHYTEN